MEITSTIKYKIFEKIQFMKFIIKRWIVQKIKEKQINLNNR